MRENNALLLMEAMLFATRYAEYGDIFVWVCTSFVHANFVRLYNWDNAGRHPFVQHFQW